MISIPERNIGEITCYVDLNDFVKDKNWQDIKKFAQDISRIYCKRIEHCKSEIPEKKVYKSGIAETSKGYFYIVLKNTENCNNCQICEAELACKDDRKGKKCDSHNILDYQFIQEELEPIIEGKKGKFEFL